MQQPDSRQVGADKPTTQLVNSLGSCLKSEGSDMVELEEVMDLKLSQEELKLSQEDLKLSQEELACYSMSTACTHAKKMRHWNTVLHSSNDGTLPRTSYVLH